MKDLKLNDIKISDLLKELKDEIDKLGNNQQDLIVRQILVIIYNTLAKLYNAQL